MSQTLTVMNEMTYNFNEMYQPQKIKADGDEIIMKLKNKENGAIYSYQFFYDTMVTDDKGKTKKKLCQIAPLRSKMIYDFKRDFGVTLKPDDFSTIVYLALWANGSWGPLDSYTGRCSFYAWLRRVAKNAIMERLVEEHLIDDVRNRTVNNTRLALLSQSPSKCKMVIDDLMAGSKYYSLLTAIYVNRLPKKKIMKQLHIKDVAEFTAIKKAGDNKLKDAILRSVEYSEEDILRDKTKHVVTVSSELVADLSEWYRLKTDVTPLSDVLGTNLSGEEVRVKTVEFLYDFSEKLNWSDQDRYIWQRRFIVNADPEGLALELDRDRSWLDTRYSRLNAKFNKAIKLWWKTHA